MQVDKFYLSTLLSGYFIDLHFLIATIQIGVIVTSMLHTSPSVCDLYVSLLIKKKYVRSFVVDTI